MVTSDYYYEIFLKKPTDREYKNLPVWDSYIKSIIINKYNMPRILSTYLYDDISRHIESVGLPYKFSSKLKGEIENIIFRCMRKVYIDSGIVTKTPIVLRKRDSLFVFISDVPHVRK